MGSVDALSRDRLMDYGSRDPRNKTTHYLLNGRPYDGAMHAIFLRLGKISYMTGPRHHAFSEPLVYSKRPVIIDTEPRIDLPRSDREKKTIYNSFRDAGLYDSMLNNTSGDSVLNRTIIPQRMVPMLNGRERPFNQTNAAPFSAPRGAVSGGRGGDQVFFSRVPPAPPRAYTVPDSSSKVPPGYMPQPPFSPTQGVMAPGAQGAQGAQTAPMAPGGSTNLLAMVPRQPNPSLTLVIYISKMANIFGRLNTTTPDAKVDPYVIKTSSVTQLSFSSDEVPQNQTRDITKILKKKLPVESGNDELVFPFDSTLFTDPLDYVAEVLLPSSLGTASTKAIGVQWCFSEASPISAGCFAVLVDSKALQSETTTDPGASTFTVIHSIPADAVSETTYTINVLKYVPGQTQQRLFSWSSMDTPAMVCAKWKVAMDPSISFSGSSQSFGHAALSYDIPSDRFYGSNASKTGLGLNHSTALNVRWEPFMNNSPFANIASCAYVRSGVIIDSTKRITVDVIATGSQGTTARQVKYDITRLLDEQNALLAFFDPLPNSDVLFDFLLFAGDTEIVRNPEGSSSVSFYNQIYKPVLRICGGTIVGNEYTGVVSPVSRLTLISDGTRALTLSDFENKRLPTTIGHDSFFSGDIIGRASNGDPFNVMDTLETLTGKEVAILSCTPTSDSWLETTDNAKGSVQYHVTPAYSLEDAEAFTKDSPSFVNNINVTTNQDWNNSEGWSLVSSSTFQNNTSYAANNAFDKRADTFWASADSTFNSAGVGSQHLTMEYPRSSLYPGVTCPTAWTLSGSNDTTFTDIQSYEKTNWVANQAVAFDVTADHEAYRFFRFAFTRVKKKDEQKVKKKNTSYNTRDVMSSNKFKSNATNLARASYMSLSQFSAYAETLGYTLDEELSRPNTLVFVDRSGQPVVAHRGSTTAKDFLVDDTLIALGAHNNTDGLKLARSITQATEKKYGRPANSVGHSLGGRLAEQSGAKGQIITLNKAAGLADIGRRQPSGTRQTDVRSGIDAVSALSSLARRPESQPIVYVNQRGQANRFLPGPIRYLYNTVRSHSLGNFR
ncbi:hypothetical protein T492DRAFT_836149 [Pavlovales sp. CCMP2436]|nr:hypothetical protein T492DRAFT_836149 [Pavlovales sp. CCMP2436]